MLASMADNPIIFAMANPNPEISFEDAMATRDDMIFATGDQIIQTRLIMFLDFLHFQGCTGCKGINHQ